MMAEVQIDELRVQSGLAQGAYLRADEAVQRANAQASDFREALRGADGPDGWLRVELAGQYAAALRRADSAAARRRKAALVIWDLGLSTRDINGDDIIYAQRAVRVRRALDAFGAVV